MIEAFAWMLIGHAVADYPLQGDWLSKAKNPSLDLVPGQTIWPMALLSHAAIHAGAVKMATGSWALAGCEFVAHTLIDYAKCRGQSSRHDCFVARLGKLPRMQRRGRAREELQSRNNRMDTLGRCAFAPTGRGLRMTQGRPLQQRGARKDK